MRRAKILIITHSAVLPTGMAETTRLLFNALLEKYPHSYEIYQIGLMHVHAVTPPSWPIYPTRTVTGPDGRIHLAKDDLDGEQTFRKLLPQLKPDIVFAFNDPQHLGYLCSDSSERKHKLVLYVNVDGFPAARKFETLLNADIIVTLTDFGRRVLLANHASLEAAKVAFMYSPADVSRFSPVSEAEKNALRADLLPPWIPRTAFILGWVGFNQWRKQVWIAYQVIHLLRTGRYLVCQTCEQIGLLDSFFSIEFPMSGAPRGSRSSRSQSCPYCGSNSAPVASPIRDVFLWLHMPNDDRRGTWPLNLLERLYDVQPGRDIHYTEGLTERSHFSVNDMPLLYQLWDALLYLSGGEGFGLPAWESMCTGIPIIYSNYSGHAEFLGAANAGIPVEGILQPEPRTCTLRLVASVPHVLREVRRLYFNPGLGSHLGSNGRRFVEKWDIKTQVERWNVLLRNLIARNRA